MLQVVLKQIVSGIALTKTVLVVSMVFKIQIKVNLITCQDLLESINRTLRNFNLRLIKELALKMVVMLITAKYSSQVLNPLIIKVMANMKV